MAWLASIFILTMLMGMPIVFVLGLSAMGYFYFTDQTHLMIVLPSRIIAGMDQFVLLAIPLFIMAGNVMASGGLTTRLVGFANSIVGRFRGGLSLTAVWGGFLFGGVSGSAAADAAALGTVLIPDMEKQGYDVDYSAGLIAVASLMAPLIPPSIAMIIYGALSSTSIGQLFIAGVVPGVLLAVLLSFYAVWVARRKGYPVEDVKSFVSMGVLMEHSICMFVPSTFHFFDREHLRAVIGAAGVDNTFFGSDLGQQNNPTPVEGFRGIIGELIALGYGDADIRQMVGTNAARFIGLE